MWQLIKILILWISLFRMRLESVATIGCHCILLLLFCIRILDASSHGTGYLVNEVWWTLVVWLNPVLVLTISCGSRGVLLKEMIQSQKSFAFCVRPTWRSHSTCLSPSLFIYKTEGNILCMSHRWWCQQARFRPTFFYASTTPYMNLH